jgi:hypothetical protein
MLFSYACCISPFNYLLPHDGVQLAETHAFISCINKSTCVSLNTVVIIVYYATRNEEYNKMRPIKNMPTLTVISK